MNRRKIIGITDRCKSLMVDIYIYVCVCMYNTYIYIYKNKIYKGCNIRRPQPSAGERAREKVALTILLHSWGSSLASNASRRLRRRLLLHSGSSVKCPAAPLPEAFAAFWTLSKSFSSRLQKATLGSSLPPNPSRRPCHRLLLHSGGSSLASAASRRLRQRLLRHSGRFPRAFLVASERNVRQ